MLNDEQLTKLADTMESSEKYTEDFFEYSYAKLALADRINNELSTPGCASRLAGTFGSKAKIERPLKDIANDLADEIEALEVNDVYPLIGTWENTMSVLIDVL
ncbi:MAG: hypothetical protein IAA89_06070 [Firmicutes bacterium]|uniref:Uncharacterized protein n=1 Tax=Candidatus Gallilactobacillus intestinavium TaxID=2840838 RepID=A0A9D9E603_9LACO|nr:hypothetical protein [Candidatus Gallilactobacillus intestinavium]